MVVDVAIDILPAQEGILVLRHAHPARRGWRIRAKAKTKITLAAPASSAANTAFSVSGKLKAGKKAVAKAPVVVQALNGKKWKTIAKATTDTKGAFKAQVKGLTATTTLRASFAAKGKFKNAYKASTSKPRTVTVAPPPTPHPPPPPPPPAPDPLIVATLDLVSAERGTAYSATLLANGGVAPYSWSVVGGALPAGMTLAANGTLSGTPSVDGTFTFTVRVTDSRGVTADRALSLVVAATGTKLPALPGSVSEAALFLTTGPNPIQTGVVPNTLILEQVSVVTGKVVDADTGDPVPDAVISIVGRPELGETKSFGDGQFAIAVNAGGELTVNVAGGDFLPVQRIENVAWSVWYTIGDVQVTRLDPIATEIQLGASQPQFAAGSIESDSAGERQAALLFEPGTAATMTLPDGSTEPIEGSMTVRATEFTVGQDFREAMPAQLPSSSGYTYAAEFSIDEALEAGATTVEFNKPVTTYVDNFLGLFPGVVIPGGYLDREQGRWIAGADGVVIDLIGEEDGQVLIDLDDDPDPDPELYSQWGIDDAERELLAQRYPNTSPTNWVSLWRVQVQHFTPWDYNLPMGPPEGAGGPPGPGGGSGGGSGSGGGGGGGAGGGGGGAGGGPEERKRPCSGNGSRILCETQVLQEGADLTGTPLSLSYTSDRVPGRLTDRELKIPIRDGSDVGPLQRIKVSIAIAGRTFTDEFDPDDYPESTYTFIWDGLDAEGVPLEGDVTATITVGYGYYFEYKSPETFENSFARFAEDVTFTRPIPPAQGGTGGDRDAAIAPATRGSVDWISRTYTRTVARYDARKYGNGGWRFDQVHRLDTERNMVDFGDGRSMTASGLLAAEVSTVAGTGYQGYYPGSGEATSTSLGTIRGIGAAPDGTLYFADATLGAVSKITPEGEIVVVAGGGYPADGRGDGGQATDAHLEAPWDVAIAADGTLFIADAGDNRIRRVKPDGTISTVFGGGTPEDGIGDNLLGTQAKLSNPRGVALAASGELYVADTGHDRVRVLYPDGSVSTIAGGGSPADGVGDGGLGFKAALVNPVDVTVGQREVFIADSGANRIRAVSVIDGMIRTYAGNGDSGAVEDGVVATDTPLAGPTGVSVFPDGTLLIADRLHNRIRSVSNEGIIDTVFGSGHAPSWNENGDGGLPREATLDNPYAVAALPSGGIAVADTGSYRIREAAPAIRGVAGAAYAVPDPDADVIYQFDQFGRHLGTVDAVSAETLLTFAYDSAGRLISATDQRGLATTVERDANGVIKAVVAPTGERTSFTVNGAGWIGAVTNNAGQASSFTYDAGGLMVTATDAAGGTHRFDYDDMGRLVRDENPDGGYQLLSHTKPSPGVDIVTTTSSTGRTRVVKTEIVRAGQPGAVSPLEATVGGVRRTVTEPDGSVSVSFVGDDDSRWSRDQAGVEILARTRPDERWGALARVVESVVVTTPDGNSVTTTHDVDVELATPGDPLSVERVTETTTNPFGTATKVTDVAERTISVTGVDGITSEIEWNQYGEIVREQEGTLAPTVHTYDSMGRRISTTTGFGTPAQSATTWTYDGAFIVAETDAAGKTTTFVNDGVGRVLSTTYPDGATVQTGYDGMGRLTSVTPAGKPAHQMGVSVGGRLLSYNAPVSSGVERQFLYDSDNQPTGVINADGTTTTYTRDAQGRLTGRTHTDGTSRGFQYSGTEVVGITDSGGVDVSFESAASGAPSKTTWSGAIAGDVRYGYNDMGQLSWVRVGDAAPIDITYESNGAVKSVGGLTLQADPSTKVNTGDSVGVITASVDYNEVGRVDELSYTASGSEVFATEVTERDPVGRTLRRTETIGGVDVDYTYGYDDRGRLLSVRKDGVQVESYTYDANGNRLTVDAPGLSGSATYNGRDQLVSGPGGATFTYDAEGQLAGRTGAGAATYRWDRFGFLAGATVGATTVDYAIDGMNQRVGRKVDGVLTDAYVYDQSRRLVGWLDGDGDVVATFAYAMSSTPAIMVKEGVRYRLVTDLTGSVRAVVNTATGAVVQRISYDAYGRVLADTNPGFQPFGYAGGLTDRVTGLVHFDMRDYDPQTGRWISLDQIGFDGGDANLYNYVGGNPVDFSDPSGAFGFFPDPYYPLRKLWDYGANKIDSTVSKAVNTVNKYRNCIMQAVETTLDVVSLVPIPGVSAVAGITSQALKCVDGIAGGCTTSDLALTAAGLIPGGRLGAKALQQASAAKYAAAGASRFSGLGKAKAAYDAGVAARNRVQLATEGMNMLSNSGTLVSLNQQYGPSSLTYSK